MPKNRVMYLGVLLIAATALLWLGAELAKRIEWILPYTGAIGAGLLVIGVVMEIRKRRPSESEATSSETHP